MFKLNTKGPSRSKRLRDYVPLLAGFGLWLCLAHPSQAQRIGYYRFYHQDASLGFLFAGKVPDEDTARARCYRAYYDRDGKLVKFDMLSAQELDASTMGYCTVEIEYTDSSRRHAYFDADGGRVEYRGTHVEEIVFRDNEYIMYSEDRLGFRLAPNDEGCDHYRFTIDPAGKQRRVTCMNDSLGPVSNEYGFTSVYLNYDEYGNEVLRVFEGDTESVTTPYGQAYAMSTDSTTPSGELIRSCFANESGQLLDTACIWYKQDALGYVAERKYTDAAGQPLKWETFTTDKYGNTLSTTIYDGDHKLAEKHEWSWNSHNQVVRYAESGKRGSIKSTLYEYDVERRLSKISKFDSLGRPWKKAFAALRFLYGEDGDTRVMQFLNGDDELIGIEPDGIAQISYRYEGDKLMQISYHDVNAMPTESSELGGAKLTFLYEGKELSTATLWSKRGAIVRTYARDQLYLLLLMLSWNKLMSRYGAGSMG